MATMSAYYTKITDDDRWDFMNVSAVVGGEGGVNHPDDVMVVQALLLYLPTDWRGVPDRDCSQPTGTFDKATARAIKKYQETVNKRRNSGRLVADGRISPAHGKFVYGRGDYMWTIISLNYEAAEFGNWLGLEPDVGYMDNIWELWPQVRAALNIGNN